MTEITIAVPEDLKERAERMAAERGASLEEFVRETLEKHLRAVERPWSEDPFFADREVWEGSTPPEEEHPFEAVFREAQEFAKQVLEERERLAKLPRSEDPLFKDVPYYDGPAPSDLSARHDHYLYGDKD
jgi:hypothetical protein